AQAVAAASASELAALREVHAADIVALTARVDALTAECERLHAIEAEMAVLTVRAAELPDERASLQAATAVPDTSPADGTDPPGAVDEPVIAAPVEPTTTATAEPVEVPPAPSVPAIET